MKRKSSILPPPDPTKSVDHNKSFSYPIAQARTYGNSMDITRLFLGICLRNGLHEPTFRSLDARRRTRQS